MDLWLSLVEQKVGCSVLIQCICICISFLCSFVSRYLFPFFLLFSEWFKPCVCISTMRALSCVNSIYVYITLRALLYTRVYTSRCVTQQNATNKLKKNKKEEKEKKRQIAIFSGRVPLFIHVSTSTCLYVVCSARARVCAYVYRMNYIWCLLVCSFVSFVLLMPGNVLKLVVV